MTEPSLSQPAVRRPHPGLWLGFDRLLVFAMFVGGWEFLSRKTMVDYRTLASPSFAALALVNWVKDHRAAAFDKAVVKAMDDPDFAAAMRQKIYPTPPQDAVVASAKSDVSRMPKDGVVSPELVRTPNDVVRATDDSLKAVTAAEVSDSSLLGH